MRIAWPVSAAVLEVIYLIFNEGYSATSGDDWVRPELCGEALRLGRVLAGLMPDEPEVHGLVALMEFQSSRLHARVGPTGGARSPARPGPPQVGPPPHRPGRGRPGPGGRNWQRPAAPTLCRPRSLPATPGPSGPRRPTGMRSSPSIPQLARITPLADRRAQPRRRGVAGLGAGAGPGPGRPPGRDGHARPLPPALQRARRPARAARSPRRGGVRVRAGGGTGHQRSGAHSSLRARPGQSLSQRDRPRRPCGGLTGADVGGCDPLIMDRPVRTTP